jgi:hypothetical protein
MIPGIRKKYNADFSQSAYENFLKDIDSATRYPADFRISETPIFLTDKLTNELISAGKVIINQLNSEDFKRHSIDVVPQKFRVPGEDEHPVFLQIDYAICKDEMNSLVPRLIELQGFPSLYGYQYLLDQNFRKHFKIPDQVTAFFSNLDIDSYKKILCNTILSGFDPENVILLEIDPSNQKTRIDFAVTEKLIGIATIDLQEVYQKKKNLYYRKGGKEIKIDRIYNRVIFDELQRKNISPNFNIFEELNVQWVGHPSWFSRISKHTLPYLKNKYNPDCYFLDERDYYPVDIHNYVLKPLYSFAGQGVVVDLSKEFLDSIKDRKNYILQRKINYVPVIETPDESSKVEIRMMYLWNEKPMLVNNLVRMSKGKMMGVDYNKNKTWVGSSISYHNVALSATE